MSVVTEVWTGADWKPAGPAVTPGDPPGSISSDFPTRQVYVFGYATERAGTDGNPGVWRSEAGFDVENPAVRAVYSEGMERVADLTDGPYTLEVIHGARHLRVRFRLEEP